MNLKWQLDWISKNKDGDIFLMFNEVLNKDSKNINYCIIIYNEFAQDYIDEIYKAENVGIYKLGDYLSIGKIVKISEKDQVDVRKRIENQMKILQIKSRESLPDVNTRVEYYFQDILMFDSGFTEIYNKTAYKNGIECLIKSGDIVEIESKNNITRDNFRNIIGFSEKLNRYTVVVKE